MNRHSRRYRQQQQTGRVLLAVTLFITSVMIAAAAYLDAAI